MIIDAYNHILPKKYQDTIDKKVKGRNSALPSSHYARTVPTLVDLDERFRIMDMFDEYMQVISIAGPPNYELDPGPLSIELARMANDALAELVQKYPDRFAAGIATMPMNDPNAAVLEAERAIKDLRLRGVEIGSHIRGKPLDSPEFMPLYQKMEELGRPVFIHPLREMSVPDYPGETHSKFRIWTKLGWPIETGKALCRLVYGRVMEKFPALKIVAHHSGGVIPYLTGRLDWSDDLNEMLMGQRDIDLKEHALVYFKKVFYDTAVNGHTGALNCTYQFAGLDQMIFATDFPFDNQLGLRLIRQTIASIDRMELSEEQKQKIFKHNATKLLRLPLGVV